MACLMPGRGGDVTTLLLLAPSGQARDSLRDALAAGGFHTSVGLPQKAALARHPRWNAFHRDRSALDAIVVVAALAGEAVLNAHSDIPAAEVDDAALDGGVLASLAASLDVLDAIRLRDLELPVALVLPGELPPRARPRHARLVVIEGAAAAAAIEAGLATLDVRPSR
ncbi:MAG: hypothetical protein FJ096_10255 [Deltaproteobacteria bacterium]|nr:hypothetical protein [Deltaproteobacteria bacterium]